MGWAGSACFAACGLPQAWACLKSGTAKGISPAFAGLWLAGELCYIAGVLGKFGWVWWLMANYLANLASLAVICWHLAKDRKRGLK